MQITRKTLLFDATRTIARFSSISARLTTAQDRAATGLAILRPSDAPAQWAQVHGLASAITDHQRWGLNMDRAEAVYDAADAALDEAENIVTRAIERAVQAASQSLPTFDRTAMAPEIAGMREDLLRLANTRVAERYVFGGDDYADVPFDDLANYQGSTASQSVLIAHDTDVELALDGQEVFKGNGDIFQLFSDFEAALNNDDSAAVAALLPQLEDARTHMVAMRQDVGFRQARVSDTRVINESMSTLLTTRYQAAVEVDPTTAYTDLATIQTSYEAALQVTAASSGSKLFDFLR
ncbi:MAG: hypothetical protein ABMA64_22270 [Myxococcota bacterium]